MALLTKLFSKQKQFYSSRGFSAGGTVPSDWSAQDLLGAYESVGWWHAVVFRIALGMSEVSWTLFDSSVPQKPKQIFQHPVLDLLHLCNPFQTSEELIALDTIYMECLGESFWVLNNNANGEPAEIVLAYPTLMQVVPDKNFPFVKGYIYGQTPNQIPLDVNQVIHFKYPNPMNQFRGLGQASAIGVNLSAEKNADKWVDQFFYNSARPDGVIQFDYSLSDEQFDKLKKQWSEKYKGVNKAHQVALLEGGGKYIQIQNAVKDMDFPNLKQKNRDIILGIEGMPLSIMGITENVNKANSEAGDYTFARWVLKPRLDWKKAKLQEQLIPKFKNSQNLKLGFEEIVPETAEQRRLDAESGMRAGYLTVNEARIATGKDPLPGNVGDVLLIPLNLIPTSVKEIIKPPTPAPAPAPMPAGEEIEEEVEQESYKGGEGSGNFGHEGRPGEVGGSGGGGGGKPSSEKPKPSGGRGGIISTGSKTDDKTATLARRAIKESKIPPEHLEYVKKIEADDKALKERSGKWGVNAAGQYSNSTSTITLGKQATESTVRHEIGHAVWSRGLDNSQKTEVWKTYKAAQKTDHGFVSQYSTTSVEEYFAETYSYHAKYSDLADRNPKMAKILTGIGLKK